jgi:Zn-dependent M28 family amino/carboxypeptidase
LLFASPASAQEKPQLGKTAYKLTQELLAVAPKRFNGSPGHAAAEQFITSHFAPEAKDHRLDIDTFTASTPAGYQTMHNIIVRFPSSNPGKKDGLIVLGSHYETNYPLRNIDFIGANDGAATTSLLIALGQYLRAHPPTGYSVVLVFFDGEEAVQTWSDSDSTYGSRHLAAKWSQDGTIKRIKAFLLADMIGDKDLDIDQDANSSPVLVALLKTAAKNTSHSAVISKDHQAMEDDTVPFEQRGVPSLDIIDYNYGPLIPSTGDHAYHHTPKDTIDKISPQSLQTSADLFLELIHLLDQK